MEFWHDGDAIVIGTEEGTIAFATDEEGLFCFQTGDVRVELDEGYGTGYERTEDIEAQLDESTIYDMPCGRIAVIEKYIAFGQMIVFAIERSGQWFEAVHVLKDPIDEDSYEVVLYGSHQDYEDMYRVYVDRDIERRI